jgi:hypothetical protein
MTEVINTREKLTEICMDFIKSEELKTIVINSDWGSGKTFYGMKPVFEYSKKKGDRCIFITENNTLNKQFKDKFQIESHLSIVNNRSCTHKKKQKRRSRKKRKVGR